MWTEREIRQAGKPYLFKWICEASSECVRTYLHEEHVQITSLLHHRHYRSITSARTIQSHNPPIASPASSDRAYIKHADLQQFELFSRTSIITTMLSYKPLHRSQYANSGRHITHGIIVASYICARVKLPEASAYVHDEQAFNRITSQNRINTYHSITHNTLMASHTNSTYKQQS